MGPELRKILETREEAKKLLSELEELSLIQICTLENKELSERLFNYKYKKIGKETLLNFLYNLLYEPIAKKSNRQLIR